MLGWQTRHRHHSETQGSSTPGRAIQSGSRKQRRPVARNDRSFGTRGRGRARGRLCARCAQKRQPRSAAPRDPWHSVPLKLF